MDSSAAEPASAATISDGSSGRRLNQRIVLQLDADEAAARERRLQLCRRQLLLADQKFACGPVPAC